MIIKTKQDGGGFEKEVEVTFEWWEIAVAIGLIIALLIDKVTISW